METNQTDVDMAENIDQKDSSSSISDHEEDLNGILSFFFDLC